MVVVAVISAATLGYGWQATIVVVLAYAGGFICGVIFGRDTVFEMIRRGLQKKTAEKSSPQKRPPTPPKPPQDL
jgi:hypothetical protein